MPKKKKSAHKVDPAVTAAIVTLIGSLVTLLITYEPIKNWWNTRLNSTPTHVIPAWETPAQFPSETPGVGAVFTATSGDTGTPASSPTTAPTLAFVPAAGVMTAQINSNYLDGKAPFTSTFRAGASYVAYADGKIETCEFANVCSYTWDVREKNGVTIHGPEVGGSQFSYHFAKKGEFTVVVYVCRRQACNFAAVNVTVR